MFLQRDSLWRNASVAKAQTESELGRKPSISSPISRSQPSPDAALLYRYFVKGKRARRADATITGLGWHSTQATNQLAPKAVDALVEARATSRECALSYLLDLGGG